MKKVVTVLCSVLMVFGFFGSVYSQTTLVDYTFTDDSPAASTIETGVSASDFTLSAGSVIFGTTNASSWTGSGIPFAQGNGGWDVTDVESAKYFLFTISTDGADSFDLENISFLYRATSAGPSVMTVEVDGSVVETIDVGVNSTIEFNETLTISNATSVEVRIYGWDNSSRSTSGGGQFHIDDVKLEGTVELGEDPILEVSNSSLSDFDYLEESGPSDAQSFNLSGLSLDDTDVTVTAPSDFEVSKTEGGSYGSSVTYSTYDGTEETVYVRLTENLGVNTYSGDISITGGGADAKTVSLSGEVFAQFSIPYSNELRTDDDYDLAVSQGFSITDASQQTAAGGYLRIEVDGYVESPTIDFTELDYLSIQFDMQTFGSGDDRKFSTLISTNGGTDYSVVSENIVPGSYETFTVDLDLTGANDVSTGKIKFEMSDGTGGSTRFRDLSIDLLYTNEITGTEGWRIFSTPTSDNSYDDLLGSLWTQGIGTGADITDGTPNVQVFDGTSFSGVSDLTNTMPPGTGFITYVYSDDNFDGNPEGFPKNLSISGTENKGTISPELTEGAEEWTLVGNPYASTIDWDALDKTELSETVYVYDHSIPGYISWNGTSGSLTDGLISSFQGFWVQNSESATSEALTISEDDKTTGGTFHKNSESSATIKLKGEMNTLISEAYLSFTESGEMAKDNHDGLKLSPLDLRDYLSVATITGDNLLDINNLPNDFEETLDIPVSVKAFEATEDAWMEKSGEVTLTWPILENIPDNWQLTLKDFETGQSINMVEEESYKFSLADHQQEKSYKNVSVLTPPTPKAEVLRKSSDSPRFTIKVSKGKTVDSEPVTTPKRFTLEQNYPNPFNPTTNIKYSVAKAGEVKLDVFNVMGQKVATLVDGVKSSGTFQVSWDAGSMSSGIYYYRLQSAGQVLTRQMTLIK